MITLQQAMTLREHVQEVTIRAEHFANLRASKRSPYLRARVEQEFERAERNLSNYIDWLTEG